MRKFIKTNLAKAKRWWRRVNSPDWDEYAERYGTVRLPGETDEQLRARIIKIITYEKPTEALSGTTLDLRAWLDFQIRRKPGETDEELRARCMNEADNELLNSGTKLDELAREDYNTTRLPGESDEELRHRLHEMVDHKHADKADNELLNQLRETDELWRAHYMNEWYTNEANKEAET